MGTGAAYWPPRCSEELYLRPLPWLYGLWGVGERQARGCQGAQGSQKCPVAGVGGTGHANTPDTTTWTAERPSPLCPLCCLCLFFLSDWVSRSYSGVHSNPQCMAHSFGAHFYFTVSSSAQGLGGLVWHNSKARLSCHFWTVFAAPQRAQDATLLSGIGMHSLGHISLTALS